MSCYLLFIVDCLVICFVEFDDYGQVNEFVDLPTFEDDSRKNCVNVPITNDENEEPDEQFMIQFVPDTLNAPNVKYPSNTINITIVDDDKGINCLVLFLY